MEITAIMFRCCFAFVVVLMFLRLAAKRAVSQKISFHFVLLLIVGDLFDDVFFAEVPVSQFVVAAAVLILADIAVAIVSARSTRAFHLFHGKPTVVMENGIPNRKGLRHEVVNEQELESLLRNRSLQREKWREVEVAMMENDGALGVMKHDWAEQAQKKDRPKLREALK